MLPNTQEKQKLQQEAFEISQAWMHCAYCGHKVKVIMPRKRFHKIMTLQAQSFGKCPEHYNPLSLPWHRATESEAKEYEERNG